MIDLLAEVCQRGISMTSQTTYSDAFWTEGFTADGAGWGHGKQCLIWGYPIDGTSNALKMLNMLKGSPSAESGRDNVQALLNFLRGGAGIIIRDIAFLAWTVARMYIIPQSFPSLMPECWITLSATRIGLFTPEEQRELLQLGQEVKKNRIMMRSMSGIYSSTRWFFNNDDLIKKTPDYHITIKICALSVVTDWRVPPVLLMPTISIRRME